MGSFALDVSKWCGKSLDRIDIVSRKIALEMFRRVILRTPVDTGRARGNWQTTVGAPAIGELGTRHNAKTGGAPIARAITVGQAWKATTGASILLTNNLPYIERLEHGYSKQAPAGMVAITVAEFGGVAIEEARE
ncbi:MAG TPA: hypothetical protein PKJ38_13680 [Planctomycetota bacterium]|nr:hypothetical protein [Planctomycetota bacterium]